MIVGRLVDGALNHRFLVLGASIAMAGAGVVALRGLPVDAFPDVSPVLVQVVTESPGLAPQEVEALVTYPIEVAMGGIPGVERTQSISAFGLSQVSIYFRDDTDIYFARQLVFERMQAARTAIPRGAGEPELGPITTGLGQVYQYLVTGDGIPADSLRAIQDWIVRTRLRTVPGVADVVSFGGDVKQYQVQVDPGRLMQYGVTLPEVVEALERNNGNAGGNSIVVGAEEYLVRGLGLIRTLDDVGNVIVAERANAPVYVRNLGVVAFGPEVRRGAVTVNGKGEGVSGIVLKRIFENTSAVIDRTRREAAAVARTLPPGVEMRPFYDQAALIQRAIATVRDALVEGGVLIVAVLLVCLGNVRSAAIVTAMLPVSALLAFILMRFTGVSANLMSLGGLAIGIGMLVDGGVVMVENVYRRLAEAGDAPRAPVVRSAAHEVARPIAFAITIIVIVFLPLFTLEGVEGKLFKPMALTITFAMTGSLLLSLTVVPVLCSLGLTVTRSEETTFLQWIRRGYAPALRWAMANGRRVVIGAVAALATSLVVVPFLGTEFVPALEEGSILYRVTLAPSASLNESIRVAGEMERIVARFPEVVDVVSKVGRAERGGDPEPVNNIEATVTLRPVEEWAAGRTKPVLVDQMRHAMQAVPGVTLGFSQPIATRVDELISGVRAQLAIKVFGDDLDTLARVGDDISRAVAAVRGAHDVQAEQVLGQPQLLIDIDRTAVARLGINVDDVQEVVRSAIGGAEAGQVFDGQRRFGIQVRYAEAERADVRQIARAQVVSAHGVRVPLAQIARIEEVLGPKQISRESNQRRLVVQANVEDRDLGGFVAEAQSVVARQGALPAGYFITWGGQFENQRRAMTRLAAIIPVTVVLIYLLLFGAFKSARQAALIILNVPFAMIGGVLALFATRQYLSVPASVGFIALFGVAVLNGVVLVTCINQLRADGVALDEAIVRGTLLRLRPVLMTALVASLGLVPLLLARGAGSEIQRPLAAVVVGGLFSSTLLTLLVLPVLYRWLESRAVTVSQTAREIPAIRR